MRNKRSSAQNRGNVPVYDGQEQVLQPPVDRFRSVAVVANSGRMLGSGLGKEIGSAEAVIRMNAAPVEGFEDDVGSRTTFRFVNGLLQKGKTLGYTSTPKRWLSQVEGEDLILMPVNDHSAASAEKLAGDSNVVRQFCDDFDNYINGAVKQYVGKVPSTGVLSALFALQVADRVRLYGYGFHQEDVEHRHYWEDWSDSHDGSHNWLREKTLIESLSKRENVSYVYE